MHEGIVNRKKLYSCIGGNRICGIDHHTINALLLQPALDAKSTETCFVANAKSGSRVSLDQVFIQYPGIIRILVKIF